ncbi:Mannose-6-phosphate isomerase [Dirofilaria immitis]
MAQSRCNRRTKFVIEDYHPWLTLQLRAREPQIIWWINLTLPDLRIVKVMMSYISSICGCMITSSVSLLQLVTEAN